MKLSVNDRIYSLNIHKFSEILEILLQTCYNKPVIPGHGVSSSEYKQEIR